MGIYVNPSLGARRSRHARLLATSGGAGFGEGSWGAAIAGAFREGAAELSLRSVGLGESGSKGGVVDGGSGGGDAGGGDGAAAAAAAAAADYSSASSQRRGRLCTLSRAVYVRARVCTL